MFIPPSIEQNSLFQTSLHYNYLKVLLSYLEMVVEPLLLAQRGIHHPLQYVLL